MRDQQPADILNIETYMYSLCFLIQIAAKMATAFRLSELPPIRIRAETAASDASDTPPIHRRFATMPNLRTRAYSEITPRVRTVSTETTIIPVKLTSDKLWKFMRFIMFECLLILCYTLYRVFACTLWKWQCTHKSYQMQYDDLMSMIAIGATIFITGTTFHRSSESVAIHFITMAVCLASMFVFGGLGQLDFAQNSIKSPEAWQFPSVILYIAAIICAIISICISFAHATTKYEKIITLITIIALLFVYCSAVLFAIASGVPGDSIPFHPHHYQIAWHLTLLVRESYPAVMRYVRWILIGIFIQGIAAYSVESMLTQ